MPEYSCKMKTLFLFVLVGVVFVIFYTYTPNITNNQPVNTTLGKSIENLERFLDLMELTAAQNPNKPVPADVLTDYNKIINSDLRQNLIGSGNEAKKFYDANQNKMTNQLNMLDSNIKVVMDDVNTKLYKQLGANYERAQQINNVRADWLSNINNLPYDVIR
jgi:hypothetical protein